ncbi:MAG: TolC family protein [Saprospiraceae bacterium]
MNNIKIGLLSGAFFLLSITINAQQKFSLEEAIDYGINNHTTIKLAELDEINANNDINQVKSIGMPKVRGGVDYSYFFFTPKSPVKDFISPAVYNILKAEGLPTTTQGPPQTFELGFVQPQQLNAELSASMIVFDGSYLYGLKAARLYRELASKKIESSEETVKTNITKAYLSILIAKENYNIVENNIKTIKKSLFEVKAIYKEGFAESLDVDRLQLSLDNLNTQQENIDGIIQLSKNLLKFQMGYQIDNNISLSDNIDQLIIKFNASNTDSNIEIEPENRVEYQLLNKAQELNQLDLKRNKAGYYPSVGAFASMKESLQRRNIFSSDETGFLPTGVVGFNVAIPIYDGGEKSAKIEKVKVNINKVNVQKTIFTNAMSLQVKNTQIAMQNAFRNLKNRRKTLAMTESIYDKTRIKFTEGLGSSIETTLAENDLYKAQSEVISALYDMLHAKVELDIALGNL